MFQSSQVLQIRLGFIANRKYKSTWCQVYRNTKPNQAKFCELILHVNTEKFTDFDLNHQIQWFSVSFHNEKGGNRDVIERYDTHKGDIRKIHHSGPG